MRLSQLNPAVLSVIASLGIMGCAIGAQREHPHARTPMGAPVRRLLPASSRGAHLIVGVDQRNLPEHRVNLQIHLLARKVFRGVRVTLTSSDPKLVVPSGCTFPVLRPPVSMVRRRFTTPLPVIPLCSVVLSAPKAGTYPLDLRTLDSRGKSLAPPIFISIRILPAHDKTDRPAHARMGIPPTPPAR